MQTGLLHLDHHSLARAVVDGAVVAGTGDGDGAQGGFAERCHVHEPSRVPAAPTTSRCATRAKGRLATPRKMMRMMMLRVHLQRVLARVSDVGERHPLPRSTEAPTTQTMAHHIRHCVRSDDAAAGCRTNAAQGGQKS
jgi:hypothetical protein